MTMPKKSSRRITVDGKVYRWMVRKNMGPPDTEPCLRLTVEDPETKAIFQKSFPLPPWQAQYDREFRAAPVVYKSVEPKDVEVFIRSLVT
jgi:hypothetical protein